MFFRNLFVATIALTFSGLAAQNAEASEHHARFHRPYETVMTVRPADVTQSIWGPNFRVPTTVDEDDPRHPPLPPG
jgi:hypothetical protein